MGATAGEAARESLGVRGESGASRASPLCGVRLRAGAGVAGGTGVHFRAASAAGGSTVVVGRLGSARLDGEAPRRRWPAALTRGRSGSAAAPCPWTSRGGGGTPDYADLRPTWGNLASRLLPTGESLPAPPPARASPQPSAPGVAPRPRRTECPFLPSSLSTGPRL